jgi:heavy metal sensor kinase
MWADSLRTRLTLWYTGVLALVLVTFAAVSYLAIERAAAGAEDGAIRHAAEALASAVREEASHEEQGVAVTPEFIHREVADVVRAFRFGDFRFFVFAASGLLATSGASEDAVPEAVAALAAGGAPGAVTTIPGADGPDSACVAREPTPSGTYTIVVTHSLAEQGAQLAAVRRAYAVAVPVALLLAALGGSVLARKSLGPVVAMSHQAERIEATSLHERLRVPNERDEVGRLARVFNALLARLEASFEQQRRFMADASHELRTPVAIVRGEAEVSLSRTDRGADDYRDSLEIIHDEGRRLAQVVDDLFMLARADAGQRPLTVAEFYLDEVVEEAVRAVRSLAEPRGIAVGYEPSGEMPFAGDETLVNRMIVNLLENAIKYTPPGGEVRVRADARDGKYVVTVEDTGLGIPAAAQPFVFERFFRADATRSGSGPGLGLSIARWIAEAHGGRVDLVRSDDRGSTFAVTLPIAGGEERA